MSKEKVFIVLSHKHTRRPKTKDEWDVRESLEIVSQLRDKHYQMSSAIGDYINKKMITGSRVGMGEWDAFENYIVSRYGEQMTQLDEAYKASQVVTPVEEVDDNIIVDALGNVRQKTVFDMA